MNELGTATLVRAALDGVPQCFEQYEAGDARCGLGVLGMRALMTIHELAEMERRYELRAEPRVCSECGAQVPGEARLISHLNDDHRADFLTIARKLGAA